MKIYEQYMYSYPHKTAYGKLGPLFISDYLNELKEKENSLYFHIPFCESKCGYCNLFSVTGQTPEQTERYLDAMKRQSEQYQMVSIPFSSLAIGGGTPLYLSIQQLEKMFTIAKDYFSLPEESPVIIETSPNQTEAEKLALLKENKVTRLSIGIQSFHENELKAVCRKHTADKAKEALERIKKYNFSNVNIDLIYGIPGQSISSLQYSLESALSYEPDELFIYPLYVKPNTYLYQQKTVQADNTYQLYSFTQNFLKKHGFIQLSMRRFVKQMPSSIQSCGFEQTISIGCGGRSYIGSLHFCSPYSVVPSTCRKIINEFIHTKDYKKITYGYLLSTEEQKRRYLIKNLLFANGISVLEYESIFKSNVIEEFPLLEKLFQKKCAILRDGKIKLTKLGLSLSDAIGPMFISDEVKKKMGMWREPALNVSQEG